MPLTLSEQLEVVRTQTYAGCDGDRGTTVVDGGQGSASRGRRVVEKIRARFTESKER